jgi:hypothetical protein
LNRTLVACVVLMISAVVSSNAIAVERYHQSTVKWVYPLNGGDFVLGFDADSASCTASGAPKYMYVQVGQNGVNAEGSKKMYAAALLAFAMAKQMSIAFDDATPQCYINRVTVTN